MFCRRWKCEERIQYDIYGPVKDEEYWDTCKEQTRMLPTNIEVIYHKEIEPHKVKNALQQSHVFILPSRSENFGHAIYEAFSAGRPVITSNYTPWNGLLESKAGINVSMNDPVDLANAIHFFSQMDNEELKIWSDAAFAYAEKKVNPDKTRQAYKEMFEVKRKA